MNPFDKNSWLQKTVRSMNTRLSNANPVNRVATPQKKLYQGVASANQLVKEGY